MENDNSVQIHEGETGWVIVAENPKLHKKLQEKPLLLYRKGADAPVALKAAEGAFSTSVLAGGSSFTVVSDDEELQAKLSEAPMLLYRKDAKMPVAMKAAVGKFDLTLLK